MKNENDKDKQEKNKDVKIEMNEDKTQYGEFVSSYFGWLTLNKQKQNAGKLENLENNKRKDKDKEN